MFSKKQCTSIALLCGFVMGQTGCSISYSLEKSSDSVSASLDSITSISTSSSGGEEEKVNETGTLYEEDVAAVTVLYVSREKTTDDYQRQVASIAKNHGISDWEQEKKTFFGMGKGLRRAGVAEDSIVNLPYFRSIADTPHYSKVIAGYRM
ncbi:MAG: putative lipoprotein [Desulfocapsa sp.]|nr:putative lipoprotein [Desulfocapsa sp.]